MQSSGRDRLDMVGIGIGPFNLSLAALLTKVPDYRTLFLDRRESFAWHPGLLFDHAMLQSPFLKDCVTLVDPTSEFSFLNYLARTHRLHRFIVADYPNVPRRQFNQYMAWICDQLDNLRFGADVRSIQCDGAGFVVESSAGRYRAKDLVLGVGREPYIPMCARRHLGPSVFHASEYLQRDFPRVGRRIAVVGGGQTGAEVFYDLIMADAANLPDKVIWVTRRENFLPFDESPFANELYVPGYTRFFYRQPPNERRRLLQAQKLTSDAILQPLLEEIYRRLYALDFFDDHPFEYQMLVDRELTGLERTASGWRAVVSGPAGLEALDADVFVLATGYSFNPPEVLGDLAGRLALDEHGQCDVTEDFQLRWDGPPEYRMFAHNLALYTHGWVDPNFAGMAWRSAVIVNALVGRNFYDVSMDGTTVDWGGRSTVKLSTGADGSEPTDQVLLTDGHVG